MRIGFDTLVTTPLDMSLNDTPCVSCGRCAETCPTGALMPKPRVLQKYEVDESRCILCGICVDACPYDALRDGADIELAHTGRAEPTIDLMALAAIDRETEVTYIRRERDWASRAAAAEAGSIDTDADAAGAAGRPSRALPAGNGHGHGNGHDHGNGHGAVAALGPGASRVAGRPCSRRLVPILIALACSWARPGHRRRLMLIFLGQDWEDALFWIFAAVMLGAGLLVVTMRDIIRCGLAMIVCFGALAGHLRAHGRDRSSGPPR